MYPLLTQMVRDLALDNYGTLYDDHVKPEDEWVWPENAALLAGQAARLTADERAALVMGEDTEQRRIVRRYKVCELNGFLCEVFDGDLSGNFFTFQVPD